MDCVDTLRSADEQKKESITGVVLSLVYERACFVAAVLS